MKTANWKSKGNKLKHTGKNNFKTDEIFSFDINIKEGDIIQDKLWERNKDNLEKYQDRLLQYLREINTEESRFVYSQPYEPIVGDKSKIKKAMLNLYKLYAIALPNSFGKLSDKEIYGKVFKYYTAFADLTDFLVNIEYRIGMDYKNRMKINYLQLRLLEALLAYQIATETEKKETFNKTNLNINITKDMVQKIKDLDIRVIYKWESVDQYLKDYNYTDHEIYEVLMQSEINAIVKDKLYSLKRTEEVDDLFEYIELVDGTEIEYMDPNKYNLSYDSKYTQLYFIEEYALKITKIVKGE